MSKSRIEWTSAVWNPITGCSKLSDGCTNCYAEKMHKRLQAMGLEKYREPFNVVRLYKPHLNSIPAGRRKPTVFFVNSMSDLFHPDVKSKWITNVFDTIHGYPKHIFLILTKRPENVPNWPFILRRENMITGKKEWPENIWLGVTVESSKYLHRAETLQKIPAKHKFISFEPLIGNPLIPGVVNNNYFKVDWIIVGGETGSNARILQPNWVALLRDFAEYENIPFFFKQWGKGIKGSLFPNNKEYGKEYKQFPVEIAKLMEGKNSQVSPSRKMQNLTAILHQD